MALLSVTLLCLAAAAVPASRQLLSIEKARIRRALREGDLAAAERLYQAAARRHPADAQVALLGASAALLGGQPAGEVLRRTNRALLLHPADAQVHRIAAHVLSRAGRRDQVALELRLSFARGIEAEAPAVAEAIALLPPLDLPDALPQHPHIQRRLADELLRRGHPEAAQRALRRAAILDPGW